MGYTYHELSIKIKNIGSYASNTDISKLRIILEELGLDDLNENFEGKVFELSTRFTELDDNYVDLFDFSDSIADIFECLFKYDTEIFLLTGSTSADETYQSFTHESYGNNYYLCYDEENFYSDLKDIYEDDDSYLEIYEYSFDDECNFDDDVKPKIMSQKNGTYKSYIKEDDLAELAWELDSGIIPTYLDDGDRKFSIELLIDVDVNNTILDTEYIISSYDDYDFLTIDSFTKRKVKRKKIILYYFEYNYWTDWKTKFLMNNSFWEYLKENQKGNLNRVLKYETEENKLNYIDFFNWLSEKIHHDICIDDIYIDYDSSYSFIAPPIQVETNSLEKEDNLSNEQSENVEYMYKIETLDNIFSFKIDKNVKENQIILWNENDQNNIGKIIDKSIAEPNCGSIIPSKIIENPNIIVLFDRCLDDKKTLLNIKKNIQQCEYKVQLVNTNLEKINNNLQNIKIGLLGQGLKKKKELEENVNKSNEQISNYEKQIISLKEQQKEIQNSLDIKINKIFE